MRRVHVFSWLDTRRQMSKLHRAVNGDLYTREERQAQQPRPQTYADLKGAVRAQVANDTGRADLKLRKF